MAFVGIDSERVRRDAEFVVEHSNHVQLDHSNTTTVAKLVCDSFLDTRLSSSDWQQQSDVHRKFDNDEDTINWIFLVSTTNFSFWSDDKLTVTYKGVPYTGYFASCACINKALDKHVNVTDAGFCKSVTLEQLQEIFTSDSGKPLPLIERRLEVLHEVGNILLQKFGGSFYNIFKQCGRSSQKLLCTVLKEFPCYRDRSTFDGKEVWLLKRAQILLADINASLGGGAFDDIHLLTAFADYRVPQVLHHLGVLRYSAELRDRLDRRVLLENGEAMEVEIRAATIRAVDSIVKETNLLLAARGDMKESDLVYAAQREAPDATSVMFKKFDVKEDVSGQIQLKSSVQKGIRNKVVELYPGLQPYIEDIMPKKQNFKQIKCKEHLELIAAADGTILFFKLRDGDYMPVLRLLHQFPFILPHQQVDKGAIRFVLSGAQLMCPGLTSPGAQMTPGVKAETPVAVMAEGKQHALGIGIMKMSTEEILSVNKGIGIENIHYLNDGLWHLKTVT